MLSRFTQFWKQHKGRVAAVGLFIACFVAGTFLPRPTLPPRVPPPPPAPLTCAQLPALQAELGHTTDWLLRYGWVLGLCVMLGFLKATEIVVAALENTGLLAKAIWRKWQVFRSKVATP